MDVDIKFIFVAFGFLVLLPLFYLISLSFQDSQIIEGTIQQKSYQERKCTLEPTYDVALNMIVPKEVCENPRWIIKVNNEQYQVKESLYNKLEIGSFYSFSYHQLHGLSLIDE